MGHLPRTACDAWPMPSRRMGSELADSGMYAGEGSCRGQGTARGFGWRPTGEGEEVGPTEQNEGTLAWATPQKQPGARGLGGRLAGSEEEHSDLTEVAADRNRAPFSGCPDSGTIPEMVPSTKHVPRHAEVPQTDMVTNHRAQPCTRPDAAPLGL